MRLFHFVGNDYDMNDYVVMAETEEEARQAVDKHLKAAGGDDWPERYIMEMAEPLQVISIWIGG